MEALGAGEILLTGMDRDGTKRGFDLELTRRISDAISIPVIASGGVGNLQHLADGIKLGHADAVLAASIFHYGEHTVQEAKEYMAKQGIPIRLSCLHQQNVLIRLHGMNTVSCPSSCRKLAPIKC